MTSERHHMSPTHPVPASPGPKRRKKRSSKPPDATSTGVAVSDPPEAQLATLPSSDSDTQQLRTVSDDVKAGLLGVVREQGIVLPATPSPAGGPLRRSPFDGAALRRQLAYALSVTSNIFVGILAPFGPTLVTVCLAILLAGVALSFLQGALSRLFIPLTGLSTLTSYLPSLRLPNALSSLPSDVRGITLAPIVSLYCGTVGVGCAGRMGRRRKEELGGVARTVKVQAEQALDIFQSVLALGGADGAAANLHHVELWELSVAVKHTSSLQDRDFLGGQLQDLGDYTRDVKDEVIRLNSLGMNAFTWISHEFTRIEELLARASSPSSSSSSKGASSAQLDALLDGLVEKISSDLSAVLAALDRAIPLADRASTTGGRLLGVLAQEHSRVRKEKEAGGEWAALVRGTGWKGKQLRRDLELAQVSVESVKDLRRELELARSAFVEYSNNVGHFKAGVVGFHLAGHGLSVEDEVQALSHVMGDFRRTVDEAKRHGRRPAGQRTLPSSGL